ncbi:hypothetical protein N7470_008548 [Penicillium chermesinum]|nr:hypothetical protein N7470_008548 [Penicillium chermesinum]
MPMAIGTSGLIHQLPYRVGPSNTLPPLRLPARDIPPRPGIQLPCPTISSPEISIIISSLRTNQPLERYAFDLSGFPRAPAGEVNTTFEDRDEDASGAGVSDRGPAPTSVDLESQFRACLARLASACARLTPLPRDDEFSFTVCIEVREDALPPAGTTKEEQTWIVADPGKVHLRSSAPRASNGRAKTVPVRRVEAGELRLELWVEEARQKFNEPVESEQPP